MKRVVSPLRVVLELSKCKVEEGEVTARQDLNPTPKRQKKLKPQAAQQPKATLASSTEPSPQEADGGRRGPPPSRCAERVVGARLEGVFAQDDSPESGGVQARHPCAAHGPPRLVVCLPISIHGFSLLDHLLRARLPVRSRHLPQRWAGPARGRDAKGVRKGGGQGCGGGGQGGGCAARG